MVYVLVRAKWQRGWCLVEVRCLHREFHRLEVSSQTRSTEKFPAVYMPTETRYTSPPPKARVGVWLSDLPRWSRLFGLSIESF